MRNGSVWKRMGTFGGLHIAIDYLLIALDAYATMDMDPGARTKAQKLLSPGPAGQQLLGLGPRSRLYIHYG